MENLSAMMKAEHIYEGAEYFFRSLLSPLSKMTMALVLCFLTNTLIADAYIGTQWQRDQYTLAKRALSNGKLEEFHRISEQLRDYPLYPYLRYQFLRNRLNRVHISELKTFFNDHSDLPSASGLRKKWLSQLASQKRWQDFLDFYTLQSEPQFQCLQLQARIHTGNTTYLLEDIRSQWLVGASLPNECDAPFKLLYQSHLMTEDLVWQRIRLSMEAGKVSLASYLQRYLSADKKVWAKRWIDMHHNPGKWTQKPSFEDTEEAREILVYGLYRLAGRNINQAIQHWSYVGAHYDFDNIQRSYVQRRIAVRAADKGHPQSIALLDGIESSMVDADVFRWRLRTAFASQDWPQLLKWLDGFPEDETLRIPWWYWRGRALEATGDSKAARYVYQKIARERDYYGFMAADRLGIEYQMNHYPLPPNETARQAMLKLPAIQRAQELNAIGEAWQARREWHHALNRMTVYQMQVAAIVAMEFGWHDRAIFTLGKAKLYDDLVIRFPLPYLKKLQEYADKRQIDLGWVYGLVRSESAFVEEARSPAGALGLMQVMPATGKQTARSLGWKNFNSKMLLEADKNIPIGSEYLRQMLKRFNGNMILATAAYNAGPHNVGKWLPKSGCVEPDIWVEQIPFRETRKYVKRVLSYASIYDWRLEHGIVPIKNRMLAVSSSASNNVAGLSCNGETITMNTP